MDYQKIEFNGKLYSDGKDRGIDYDMIFPEMPEGLYILDLGCNIGYYSIRAALEGAKEVLGIDNHKPFLDKAKDVVKDLNIDNTIFDESDVMEIEIYTRFDVVLCLNLVHHFGNIDEVKELVKKCYAWSNKRIVFEVIKCEHPWQWVFITNRKGNKKIALTAEFFEKLLGDNVTINTFDSKATEGRMFVDIIKKKGGKIWIK